MNIPLTRFPEQWRKTFPRWATHAHLVSDGERKWLRERWVSLEKRKGNPVTWSKRESRADLQSCLAEKKWTGWEPFTRSRWDD